MEKCPKCKKTYLSTKQVKVAKYDDKELFSLSDLS